MTAHCTAHAGASAVGEGASMTGYYCKFCFIFVYVVSSNAFAENHPHLLLPQLLHLLWLPMLLCLLLLLLLPLLRILLLLLKVV